MSFVLMIKTFDKIPHYYGPFPNPEFAYDFARENQREMGIRKFGVFPLKRIECLTTVVTKDKAICGCVAGCHDREEEEKEEQLQYRRASDIKTQKSR